MPGLLAATLSLAVLPQPSAAWFSLGRSGSKKVRPDVCSRHGCDRCDPEASGGRSQRPLPASPVSCLPIHPIIPSALHALRALCRPPLLFQPALLCGHPTCMCSAVCNVRARLAPCYTLRCRVRPASAQHGRLAATPHIAHIRLASGVTRAPHRAEQAQPRLGRLGWPGLGQLRGRHWRPTRLEEVHAAAAKPFLQG